MGGRQGQQHPVPAAGEGQLGVEQPPPAPFKGRVEDHLHRHVPQARQAVDGLGQGCGQVDQQEFGAAFPGPAVEGPGQVHAGQGSLPGVGAPTAQDLLRRGASHPAGRGAGVGQQGRRQTQGAVLGTQGQAQAAPDLAIAGIGGPHEQVEVGQGGVDREPALGLAAGGGARRAQLGQALGHVGRAAGLGRGTGDQDQEQREEGTDHGNQEVSLRERRGGTAAGLC